MVTGVAYQLTDLDPLIDEKQCKLDAGLMAELGANTIRVYHVDPTSSHDACMKAFADVGIYLFLDLDTFDTQFDQVGHNSRGGVWDFVIDNAYSESTRMESDTTYCIRGSSGRLPGL